MGYELGRFSAEIGLDEDLLRFLLDEHESIINPMYEELWSYYRNEVVDSDPVGADLTDVISRSANLAQSRGLPARLTTPVPGATAKEIVIENDIGWRVQTVADYTAGRELAITARTEDETLRLKIEEVLSEVLDDAGGLQPLVEQMVLLGAIYGHVDLIVRERLGPSGIGSPFGLELVEAPRAIPILDPASSERLAGYIITYLRVLNEVEHPANVGWSNRRWRDHQLLPGVMDGRRLATTRVVEVISRRWRQVYEDEQLVWSGVNTFTGLVPVIHVQHQRQPFVYDGIGEVEPLIALQNELNTRLSDRANRVTLQSFKMYLGKGIEGFGERPVGPGQMWMTDNPDASIEAFGGDAQSPSEESHIQEVREALDKISGVTPLAAGLIRARVGTLSSENALRISMMGLLSKVERLRQSYGRALTRAFELILRRMDARGMLDTGGVPRNRQVDVIWGSPTPQDEMQKLNGALLKRQAGVPENEVLRELGYGR